MNYKTTIWLRRLRGLLMVVMASGMLLRCGLQYRAEAARRAAVERRLHPYGEETR